MRFLNKKVYMNGYNGEVIDYDFNKFSCYKVRFYDPHNRLADKDYWFSESDLESHIISSWTWKEDVKCTCGADTVYKMSEITPYHHGQLCLKFKRAKSED